MSGARRPASWTSGMLRMKMVVTCAVRADRPSSVPHDAAPHAGHKACMHLGRLICLLISLRRASCQPVTIFHGKDYVERACLLTMDMKL